MKSFDEARREQRLKEFRREIGREEKPEPLPSESEIRSRYEGQTIEASEELKALIQEKTA